MQHSILLHCWQWQVFRQYTGNALLRFCCKIVCAYSPQCCLLIRTLPISYTSCKRADVNTNMKCRSNRMWEKFRMAEWLLLLDSEETIRWMELLMLKQYFYVLLDIRRIFEFVSAPQMCHFVSSYFYYFFGCVASGV